jgi:hypothetical protein
MAHITVPVTMHGDDIIDSAVIGPNGSSVARLSRIGPFPGQIGLVANDSHRGGEKCTDESGKSLLPIGTSRFWWCCLPGLLCVLFVTVSHRVKDLATAIL